MRLAFRAPHLVPDVPDNLPSDSSAPAHAPLLPVGMHRRFNDRGTLVAEMNYDGKGRLLEERRWDDAGQLLRPDEPAPAPSEAAGKPAAQ